MLQVIIDIIVSEKTQNKLKSIRVAFKNSTLSEIYYIIHMYINLNIKDDPNYSIL